MPSSPCTKTRGAACAPGRAAICRGGLHHDLQDSQVFLAIARYESEAAARAVVAQDPERLAWERRLASLSEAPPACAAYHSAWCDV